MLMLSNTNSRFERADIPGDGIGFGIVDSVIGDNDKIGIDAVGQEKNDDTISCVARVIGIARIGVRDRKSYIGIR